MSTIGLQTMPPRPEARFWDRHADGYAKRPVPDEAAYQEKLRITREYLDPESTVLEFGCGTGSTALVHAPHVATILATDLSPRMIEIAEAKARSAGIGNVTFQCASIEDLSAPEAGFDVVLGLSILHLLRDRDAAIAKVFELLKPGGVFISSTPCIADMVPWFRPIAPIGRWLGLLPFIAIFRVGVLEQALTSAGFVIERRWQPGARKAVFIVARKPGR